jgi:quercetin dioxygenase-like cupin family protein
MAKSTITYWNPLISESNTQWQPIEGMEEFAEELTLALDEQTGDYTRLTRFKPGADTTTHGSKSHDYPEEIFVVSGKLYDAAFDKWLEAGDYASRPPGEVHGPFKTDTGCVVLEVSYPGQSTETN